jgi:hypothetical protein
MLSTQGITLTTSESLELIAYPAINQRPFLAWRPQVKVTIALPLRVAEASLHARGGQHFCLPSDKRQFDVRHSRIIMVAPLALR